MPVIFGKALDGAVVGQIWLLIAFQALNAITSSGSTKSN